MPRGRQGTGDESMRLEGDRKQPRPAEQGRNGTGCLCWGKMGNGVVKSLGNRGESSIGKITSGPGESYCDNISPQTRLPAPHLLSQ